MIWSGIANIPTGRYTLSMEPTGTRERILSEATHLFGTAGYAATSVREIVERAHTSKPTLYYYFGSKDGLYRECVREAIAGLAELVDEALSAPGPVRERLVRFLRAYVQGGLAKPEAVQLLIGATRGVGVPRLPILAMVRQQLDRLGGVLEQGAERGELVVAHPALAVRMLCGAADYVLFSALEGEPIDPDFAERLVDLLFDGIGR